MKGEAKPSLDRVKLLYEQTSCLDDSWLIPCTEEEIEEIERYNNLRLPLPDIYREFLLWMGKGAGIFLEEYSCFYRDLVHQEVSPRQVALELIDEYEIPLQLPEHAFVFSHRLAGVFWFLDISKGNNAYVQYYSETLGPDIGESFPVAHLYGRPYKFDGWIMLGINLQIRHNMRHSPDLSEQPLVPIDWLY